MLHLHCGWRDCRMLLKRSTIAGGLDLGKFRFKNKNSLLYFVLDLIVINAALLAARENTFKICLCLYNLVFIRSKTILCIILNCYSNQSCLSSSHSLFKPKQTGAGTCTCTALYCSEEQCTSEPACHTSLILCE